MTITVQFSAILKLDNLRSGATVRLPAGATIGFALGRLGLAPGQQRHLLTYLNGTRRPPHARLREGDTLQLFLPVGGG